MSLLHRTIESIKPLNKEYIAYASERLDNLTKPKGSLGKLEEFARQVVAITENKKPSLDKKAVFVLAGDHGVVEEGVSAYPREVTREMVYNFLRGGAGINALARHAGADVFIVDMGVDWYFEKTEGLITRKIKAGTKNLAKEPAMTNGEAIRSIEAGIGLAKEAVERGYNFIGVGDMGIGNTTSSSAVICAFTGLNPEELVGHGTGIDNQVWKHKVEVVKKALALHNSDPNFPIDILSKVGGFEIGGIAGVILGATSKRVPVVVDGFVSTAGAVISLGLCPRVKDYIFFSHKSAEGGHGLVLQKLSVQPILDLDMRLGEGTGAVIGMFIIEAGVKAYNEMATFEEARVSRKEEIFNHE
ncbi:MAG: nicotinate-nucleotide--dimethylbenzimidazole phosphoribosyltransferase [Deltaproteobacteria bacterium]|nr:nicotinate-nucleotide--dimethylbenzimidazole phosphoribosyltransferase [Deltaproteobacteria bacterium]